MRFDVITLFPELFAPFLASGVTRRAYESKQVDVHLWNPRDFAEGNYRRVDDRPFGGGPGMVMMAEPLAQCLAAIKAQRGDTAPVVLFSPIGAEARPCGRGALVGRPGRRARLRPLRRASTSASSTATSTCRSAWAISCSPAARSRPWPCWTRSPACSPGCWATRTATSSTASIPPWTACWIARTTPVRRSGRDGAEVPPELLSGHHAADRALAPRPALEMTARRRPDLIAAARAAGRLVDGRRGTLEQAASKLLIIKGFSILCPAAGSQARSARQHSRP